MNTPAWLKPYFDRLGSMSLAIVLLVLLAIASVIGTVLLQNQAQTDYLAQFGPLWYWTFRSLGLFDMYHSPWFLTLLGFLMVSVAVCLWRNTPRMLREMRKRKVTIEDKSLQRFHHLKHWDLEKTDVATVQAHLEDQLRDWEIKSAEKDGRTYLRADKGRWNKWGYILTHAAILVILSGGWISVHFGFRGTMNVIEGGGQENTIRFLKGAKTEKMTMPFTIQCNKFYIDFYPTGMPKTFRSNLSIYDHGKEVVHNKDIEVNHPLIYKGVRIYQASFGDGGSDIKMKLFHLNDGSVSTVDSRVYSTYRDPKTGVSMEFTGFSAFNVENMAGPGEPKNFKDLGPAVTFIMRGPGLKPVKVKTFMNPFEQKGKNVGSLIMVSLSGDKKDFQPFSLGLDFSNPNDWKLLQAFGKHLIDSKEGNEQQANMQAFRAALHEVFGNKLPPNFQHMGIRVLQAMNNLSNVPWPFIPILQDYHQVYYTGLELTRDPGMNVIWIGSAILVIGLCIMFYLPHRKLWLVIEPMADKVRLTVGGMTNRNRLGFEQEFQRILSNLEKMLVHQQ